MPDEMLSADMYKTAQEPRPMIEEETPPDLLAGPALRMVAMPKDANPSGDIFGGWVMSIMDLAGGRMAIHEARGRCTTIAVDAMRFMSPVKVGDEISCYAKVVKVGNTSIRIRVTAWAARGMVDKVHKVTEAEITYVALDEHGRPRPVYAWKEQ